MKFCSNPECEAHNDKIEWEDSVDKCPFCSGHEFEYPNSMAKKDKPCGCPICEKNKFVIDDLKIEEYEELKDGVENIPKEGVRKILPPENNVSSLPPPINVINPLVEKIEPIIPVHKIIIPPKLEVIEVTEERSKLLDITKIAHALSKKIKKNDKVLDTTEKKEVPNAKFFARLEILIYILLTAFIIVLVILLSDMFGIDIPTAINNTFFNSSSELINTTN